MDHTDFEVLDKQTLYQGFLRLEKYKLRCRLFAGGWSGPFYREVVVRFRVAAVLLYDPRINKVVLVEQFRTGALTNENGPWLLELVAGILTDASSLEQLARQEAREEAGLELQEIMPVCDYWSSAGASSERVALYCAKVDASHAGGIFGLHEENEDILAHVVDSEEAFAMVRSGHINNAATIIALQWLELNLSAVKKRWL